MKLLLFFFILFPCASCFHSFKWFPQECNLNVKMKFQECLCDPSSFKCDLGDCLEKYNLFSSMFKNEDAYVKLIVFRKSPNSILHHNLIISLPEILIKIILGVIS